MKGLAWILAVALAANGCASSPAARDTDVLTAQPGGLTDALERSRQVAHPVVSELALRARLEQALGFDSAAAADWFEVAARATRAPWLRSWAELQLRALAERVAVDATWLARARSQPELAELAEALALKLQDSDALAEARARLGAAFHWRRSPRLLRYPGRTTSPPLGPGRFAEPGAAFESHSGYIASPEDGPGLYAFELALPPGSHVIEVESECALRAFIGETSVARHEALEAVLPERIAFPVELATGQTLQLHLVSRTSVARARVFVRSPAARLAVLPPRASLARDPGPAFDLAGVELALATRDISAAHRHLAALPADGSFARLAAARLAVVDPTRAPERARTAAKAALVAALSREPAFVEARALLVVLHAEDQELEDATRVLGVEFAGSRFAAFAHEFTASALTEGMGSPSGLLPEAMGSPSGLLAEAAILAFAQSDQPRAALLAAARFRSLPRSCRARADWLDATWERLRLHPDEVLATFDEALTPLPGLCLDARLRAVELSRESFQLAAAERLTAPLLTGIDPGPDRARAEVLAAQNALARGTWTHAAEHAADALAVGGVDAFARELLGRAERLQGGPPMPRLDPARDLGLPLRDARAVIREHLRHGPSDAQDGREVLLDDRFVRVNADGSLRIRVHRILHVNDVAAVESAGELPIPDDAEILFVRTWKKDLRDPSRLRSLEPEDILEKATVSLPNLAPGDFAEWAYFYPLAASSRLTPGWRAPPYGFDSDDGPVEFARYTLSTAPGARAPVFIVDPRVRPPERPDADTWVFTAATLPRVFSEPGDPLPEARRMTLRASSGIERLPYADALAAELAFATRASPTLTTLLAEATAGLPDDARPEAILEALYDRVRRTIDEPDEASPFGVEASWVAERRRGSRALLLTALCREAGLGCELVLARPLWEGPEPHHADLDGLSYPLVRWAPVGRPARWLDPVSRWMPFGLLPPALEGVFGLSVGAATPSSQSAQPGWLKDPSLVATPRSLEPAPEPAGGSPLGVPAADPAHWGERVVAMNLTLDPRGGAILATGNERLDGVFASSWRVALVAMSPEARERVLGSIVQQALPNAIVEAVTLEHLEDDREPLTWSWRARAATVSAEGAPERGARSLQLALFPEGLTHDTVLLATRTTPLLVNRAARMRLTVTFTAPTGWAFVRAPSDQDLAYDLGRFERRSRYEELGRKVVVDKRFLLRPGVIEPDRYAAWSDAAVAIDRFDVIQVVAAPQSPTAPEKGPP